MTTVIGIGKDKIEYCGSLTESGSGAFLVLASRELPAEIAVGVETRLTFVSKGKIETQTALVLTREGRRLTFAPIGESISVRRRMETRIPARLAVDYQTEDGKFRQTQTRNVSSNGLALLELSGAPLPALTKLRLTLPGNRDAARAVVVTGSVVNRCLLDDGENVAGIVLLEMAADDRAALDRFLETQTESQAALAA